MLHILSSRLAKLLSVSLLSTLALSGCDSLWGAFVVDMGNTCGSGTTSCPVDKSDMGGSPLSFVSIMPNLVPAAGGTTVAVTGTGFTADTVVNLAGKPLQSPTTNSPSLITGMVPPAPAGCGSVGLDIQRPGTPGVSKDQALRYFLQPLVFGQQMPLGMLSTSPNHLLTANIDNDAAGTPDFVASQPGGLLVLLMSQPMKQIPVTTGALREKIEVGRVTQGPYLDILVSDFSSGVDTLKVYSWNGAAYTQHPTYVYVSPTGMIRDIQAVDIDGDGQEEYVLNTIDGNGTSTIIFLRNLRSNAKFSEDTRKTFNPKVTASSLVAGNFDGDGTTDVAMFTTENVVVSYHYAGVTAGITMRTALNVPTSTSLLVAGDWNGDQKADLALVTKDGTVQLLTWNSTSLGFIGGSLTLPNVSAVAAGAQKGFAYDVNCDGMQDLLINHPAANNGDLTIALNAGGFLFQNATISIPMGQLAGGPFVVADYNRDNLPDIVGATPASGVPPKLVALPLVIK